jgi:hypothetical protein
MKIEINKQIFCSLVEKLDLNKKNNEIENFNDWMINKVQSVHYANNEAMCNAYEKIEEKYVNN